MLIQHELLLTEAQKKIRLNWEKEMMNLEMNWDSIIVSDENKLNLEGLDGFKFYWHDVRGPQKNIFQKKFWRWVGDGLGCHFLSSKLVFLEGKQNS